MGVSPAMALTSMPSVSRPSSSTLVNLVGTSCQAWWLTPVPMPKTRSPPRNAAVTVDGVTPVGVAGDGAGNGPQQADENRDVGGRDPVVAAFDEIAQVEENGDRPGANGDVGEHGMEGMAQPGAVHERLERSAGVAEEFVAAGDNLLEEIGDRLQPALLVDETVDDVIEHRRLLSSAAARRK